MPTTANHRRISPETLEELLTRPDELRSFISADGDGTDARTELGEAWHLIHFLLTGETWGGDWPLAGAVLGGSEISDEDVGHGPARYLTPDEVREVAEALAAISATELWSRFDRHAVESSEIYPESWTGSTEEEAEVVDRYGRLVELFRIAAERGEAVVTFLA